MRGLWGCRKSWSAVTQMDRVAARVSFVASLHRSCCPPVSPSGSPSPSSRRTPPPRRSHSASTRTVVSTLRTSSSCLWLTSWSSSTLAPVAGNSTLP